MGFSDKMRESLGAEGARVEVSPSPGTVAPGGQGNAVITIVGGSKPAHVDAIVVRVVEADRHWTEADGTTVAETEAAALEDRRHLTAAWTRNTVSEARHEVGATVEPGARHEVEVAFEVPGACFPTSPARSHTLNVQADIKGQIDPTGNARFEVG
jgi:sporulation-control protein spo0M